MQQKNFLLFIVLSILVMAGWWWVQNQLWPPAPPKKKDDPAAKQDDKKPPHPLTAKEDVAARVCAAWAAGATLEPAHPLRLAVGAALLPPPRPLSDSDREKLHALAAALHPQASGLPARLAAVGTWFKGELRSPVAGRTLDLSDEGFFLQVKLTTLGGAVESLVLPKFQAADSLGRPVTAEGKKVPLTLIPRDDFNPSFAIYHYLKPDADPDTPAGRPVLQLGREVWTVEPDPKTGKEIRELEGGRRQVVLWCDRVAGYEDLKIIRTFTVGKQDYHVDLQVEIVDSRRPGKDVADRSFRYQTAGGHGLPIEGDWYASVHLMPYFGLVNQGGNFWRELDETQQRIWLRQGGDRVPQVVGASWVKYAGVGNQYFASLTVVSTQQADGVKQDEVVGYARATLESQEKRALIKEIFDDYSRVRASVYEPGASTGTDVDYYLLDRARERARALKLKPLDEVLINGYSDPDRGMIATNFRRGRVPHPWQSDIMVRTVSEVKLRPGARVVHKYLLYNGPVKVSTLGQFTGDKAVPPALVEYYWDTLNLRTLTDYRSPGPFGWFANQIFWTDLIILFTRLMGWLLNILHWIIPNYGVAIILLTIIVRSLMFPISRKQAYLSIKMQEIAPEVRKLQEKYKDPQQRTRAVMELYRKHGVNPFGGCLTLLLQLPIFMGLYFCLQESIHFRLAPFVWMENLAAPDMLIWWGEGIPVISDPDAAGVGVLCLPMNPFYLGPFFNLLPILAVGLMLAQQKLLMPPAVDEQQAFQQKMMKWMMIFFGLLFYKVAAGLCIYFTVSSVWGLLERKMLPKKAGAPGGPAPPPSGGGGDGGPGKPAGPAPGGRGKQKGKKGKQPGGPKGKVGAWWQDLLDKAKKK